MADIFISYSRSGGGVTKTLARKLEERGYSVWWDTKLLGGEQFAVEIAKRIREAKAAIVIWTPTSVRSKFVYDEATRADRANKLIPLRVPQLDLDDIPPPFGALHTEDINQIEKIVEALARLGVVPGGKQRPAHSGDYIRRHDDDARGSEVDDLIWKPQLRTQYNTFGIVEFGDVVTVKRNPVFRTEPSGVVTVLEKGLVMRKRYNADAS
jgi:hypothetical protein